ncbi:MAG: ATP-binding cassette domain-containing protein [Myxococcota bacterium]
MSAVWKLSRITKRFRGRGLLAGPTHTALDNVDFSVQPGERVAIIGESGSGKTTLARVGLRLVPADSGQIELCGSALVSPSRGDTAQLLFQDPRAMLHPGLTIGALLRESARRHRPGQDPTALMHGALDDVGLGGRDRARPHQLSGGERRRAGLARVLLAQPKLLVADEPTAGLDAHLKAELVELMIERAGPECALVLISHDLPLVLWAAHRVVVMDSGVVVDRFDTKDVFTHSLHPRTKALLEAAGLQ